MSQTTTTPTKKIRFYSREEIKALEPYIKNGEPIREAALAEFCTKYNRSFASVQIYIYTKRKKIKQKRAYNKNQPVTAQLTESNSPIKMNKGEFKIPITNWNVSSENGQFYFVVKF
jgi:hypothetical protein